MATAVQGMWRNQPAANSMASGNPATLWQISAMASVSTAVGAKWGNTFCAACLNNTGALVATSKLGTGNNCSSCNWSRWREVTNNLTKGALWSKSAKKTAVSGSSATCSILSSNNNISFSASSANSWGGARGNPKATANSWGMALPVAVSASETKRNPLRK